MLSVRPVRQGRAASAETIYVLQATARRISLSFPRRRRARGTDIEQTQELASWGEQHGRVRLRQRLTIGLQHAVEPEEVRVAVVRLGDGPCPPRLRPRRA